MPRPRNPNPQPKKYIVKQKLKNGGYHVLERTCVKLPKWNDFSLKLEH